MKMIIFLVEELHVGLLRPLALYHGHREVTWKSGQFAHWADTDPLLKLATVMFTIISTKGYIWHFLKLVWVFGKALLVQSAGLTALKCTVATHGLLKRS